MAEALTTTTQKALIVDDSRTAQIKLQRMLRPYPLEIVTVDSAEEALFYLKSEHPTVIFMDHSMPGMDGLEALGIIRSNPKTAVIPVIMYTAQKGDVYVGRAAEAGANDVLSKDVMDEQGLEKVLRFLRLPPAGKPVGRQNVTSISDRLVEQTDGLNEAKAIAAALSGKSISSPADEENKQPVSNAATPSASTGNETTSSASWEDALAEVADSNQKALQSAIQEMKTLVIRAEQNSYRSSPKVPLPSEADKSKERPVWPSFLIVGLLLFAAYQLVEIRNDQNELDRTLREIQIRMEVE